MNKTVNITKINIPIIIKADNAPVLPSSKVEARALGISATIPEKIIKEIQKKRPFKATLGGCIIKKVNQTVIILKEY